MQKIHIHIWQKILLVVSVFFVVLSLVYELYYSSNMSFPEGENNIVFSLDVSQSMNVLDMWNYSRLDAAKRKIIDIIRENPENSYALNIFAGESMRILPFTNDIGLISTFLLWLDSRNITKQWSDIPWALSQAYESFNELQSWKVILLTDGSDESIDIDNSIKKNYKTQQIDLIILWVWSSTGWYIPSESPLSPYKMYNGSRVVSSLNTKWLQDIAEDMDAEYINMQEYNDYQSLYSKNTSSNFPFVFLLFVLSWSAYLALLYRNIFLKI